MRSRNPSPAYLTITAHAIGAFSAGRDNTETDNAITTKTKVLSRTLLLFCSIKNAKTRQNGLNFFHQSSLFGGTEEEEEDSGSILVPETLEAGGGR